MTCQHRYQDTGLQCSRLDDHDPAARGGHVYDCGDVPDRHAATSGGEG